MIKAKLEFYKFGYIPLDFENYKFYILSVFLSTEMTENGYDFFYDWMQDPNLILTSGNVTGVKKIKDKVLMHLLFDSDLFYSDQEKYSLTIPLGQLISISEQWHEVIKIRPPFIIITQDKGIYTLSASQE